MTLKGYLTLAAVLEREHFDFDERDEEIATLRSELIEDVIRYNTLSVEEKKRVLSVLIYGKEEAKNE